MVAGSPYNPVSMTKKVSESRAPLPRQRDDVGEAFASITADAAAFVERNPALRAKVLRAVERLSEAFPGHRLHLVLAFDHESGDRDLSSNSIVERRRWTISSHSNANGSVIAKIPNWKSTSASFTDEFRLGGLRRCRVRRTILGNDEESLRVARIAPAAVPKRA
jgi:hypothetical protein